MSASTVFTIIIALVLLRVFWLRIKAASMRNENFKQLPPKDQLAVLKECLLNNPSEINLLNLKQFSERTSMNLDVESYRPFLKKQQELSRKPNALAEDNELYSQEARWLDSILPPEFEEAQKAKDEGNQVEFIQRSLEGIARLYSDEAILAHLQELEADYPKATELLAGYQDLMECRDTSGADDKSLEELRKKRDTWEEQLLNYTEI